MGREKSAAGGKTRVKESLSLFFFFFFPALLGIELRALCLLDRHTKISLEFY
jgi:hypothetical protein